MPERTPQKRIWIFAAPVLTACLLLGIYALRGIYPFGTLSVAQGDLEQQYCAMYAQLRGVLLGEASPLFSWLTALGRGQSMDMMIFGCASPLNLLFLLFPRDALLACMSYYVLLKLSLCALTMSWYIRRRFPALPPAWIVFFGVAYALSGHMLLHFHNTLWFEAMILLPVYLYYAERMLLGGRGLPYALLLAALLMINFYPAAMICLFTFFAGGAYILLLLPREARGRAVLRIALCTVLALALSAVQTVPAALQMLRAARLGYAGAGLFTPFTEYSVVRGFALSVSCFALVLLPLRLHTLLRGRAWRQAAFMLTVLGAMLLPLFFDGIDTLWHFGGNIGFAYRYGFIAVFVVLAFCAVSLSERTDAPPIVPQGRAKRIALYAATALVLVAYAYVMLRDGRNATRFISWNTSLLTVLTLATFIAYLFALLLPGRRMARAACLAILLMQTACYGYSAFLADDTVSLPDSSAVQAAALRSAFPETDDLSRVKLEDASLTINYPKYLGRPALSSFSSSTTQNTLDTARAMGYGISAYAVQDCGGTLFSDALLNVKATVSRSDRFCRDRAYALRTQVGDYYVYDNAYTLPFGVVGSDALAAIRLTQQTDCFSLHNALYAAISHDETPLLHVVDTADSGGDTAFMPVSEPACARYRQWLPADGYGVPATAFSAATLPVSGTQRVYVYARGIAPGAKLSALAELDGEVVRVTDEHPITYLDGAYDLGEYTDTTVTVVVAGEAAAMRADVCVALLDMEKLAAWTAAQNAAPAVTDVVTGKRSLALTVTAQGDTDILFLPMQYSTDWRARLDGRSVTPCCIAGNYMGFALSAGTHALTMTYRPAGLTAGIVCSLLALAAAVWLGRRERAGAPLFADAHARVCRAAEALLAAVWLAAVALIYVLPALYALLMWYKNLH